MIELTPTQIGIAALLATGRPVNRDAILMVVEDSPVSRNGCTAASAKAQLSYLRKKLSSHGVTVPTFRSGLSGPGNMIQLNPDHAKSLRALMARWSRVDAKHQLSRAELAATLRETADILEGI